MYKIILHILISIFHLYQGSPLGYNLAVNTAMHAAAAVSRPIQPSPSSRGIPTGATSLTSGQVSFYLFLSIYIKILWKFREIDFNNIFLNFRRETVSLGTQSVHRKPTPSPATYPTLITLGLEELMLRSNPKGTQAKFRGRTIVQVSLHFVYIHTS